MLDSTHGDCSTSHEDSYAADGVLRDDDDSNELYFSEFNTTN